MRTTVDLDDDVLAIARAIAAAEGRSLRSVLSEALRRGLRATGSSDVFPMFDVPDGADRITSELVERANDDG